MNTAECHLIANVPLAEQCYLVFPLTNAIQSHIPGQPSSVNCKFCLMEWALNPVIECLVTLNVCATTIPAEQAGMLPLAHRVGSWVGGYPSPLVVCIPPSTLNTGEVKALPEPSDFSMFTEIRTCCLQQKSLTISVRRAINSFGNNLSCLGVSTGPRWPTTQLEMAHYRYWRFSLVVKDTELAHCFLIIWCLPSYFFHTHIF